MAVSMQNHQVAVSAVPQPSRSPICTPVYKHFWVCLGFYITASILHAVAQAARRAKKNGRTRGMLSKHVALRCIPCALCNRIISCGLTTEMLRVLSHLSERVLIDGKLHPC